VGAPVILQASAGARKYAGEAFIKHLIQAAVEAYPHIPLVMHQDHGQSPAICQGAIDLGFGSVMMDGSLRRRQDHRQLRLQRRRHAQGGRHGAPPWASRSKASWAAWATWRPVTPATRRTASAPTAS
jgi:hypothetical protein